MQAEIVNKPSFANIVVRLSAGDKFIAEAGAMTSMSTSVQIDTKWSGGFFRAILKRVLGGESMFINVFSTATEGELRLTQPLPGDIDCLELNGNTMYLQPGAFIACEPGVKLGLSWAGWRMLIAREGLFRLKVSGTGRVWFGAYGGIFQREIDSEYIVDSGHLVAYEPTVKVRVALAGGIISSFFSGEGLVTKLNGPGRIYMQSRSFDGLAAWTNAHLY
ncbi:MAG: TIGR00266 family protein [Pirellulaceae bacterium]|jgi:uncharacterized protein (TIGR00266 family)|nr:TIGR00266 family protein [Pirellulaceae bacterium]